MGVGAIYETADFANGTATAANLLIGQSGYGAIGVGNDSDWYRVSLVQGQTYEFRLHGIGYGEMSDPFLRLRNASGSLVASNNDTDLIIWSGFNDQDSRIVYTATATGNFYLDVQGVNISQTGNYIITAAAQNPTGMVFTADEIAWQLVTNGNDYFGEGALAFNVGNDNALTVNVTALTQEGQNLARAALRSWTDVTGIAFIETASVAEITFDDSQAGENAFATTTFSNGVINSAAIMITTGWLSAYGTTIGSYSFQTYIHEIGHALGLAHGGNYNGDATFGVDNYYQNDSVAWSIMSYMNATDNTFVGAVFDAVLTPSISDIVAIQYLYGDRGTAYAGNTTYGYGSNTGNTVLDSFTTLAETPPLMTIWDEGGTDTLNFANYSGTQIINLADESFSNVIGGTSNLAIARGVTIENAFGGSGGDSITGNAAANDLRGNGGADVLFGGAGADTLTGGAGNDGIDGGSGNDTALFSGARSNFFVRSFVSGGQTLTSVSAASGTEGADTLVNVETLGFSGGAFGLAGAQQNLTSNMDGSLFDDVLFRNSSTGQVYYLNMTAGAAGSFQTVLGALPTGWRPFDSGDVTGDGRADTFVQDTNTGSIYTVNIASGSPVWGTVNAALTSSYEAIAAGDVTRDGVVDVLVRDNATGATYIADMDAGGTFGGWLLGPNPGTGWRTVGLGDFNRDGASDVLVQEISSGITYYRDIANSQWGFVSGAVGSAWVAREAADMNGDGYCDVVFRNTSTNDIWYVNMLGGTNTGWGVVTNGLAGWDVRGTADVDNDGYRDVLVQNLANGTTYYADMNAGVFAGWGTVTGAVGTNWLVV